MEGSVKKWTKETEDSFNKLIDLFKKSLILDAELYSKFRGLDEVSIQCFEVALYKTVMTLNESNKASIIKKSGPEGLRMINAFEEKAINDITVEVINGVEIDKLQIPDELKDILNNLKDHLKRKENEEEEE